MIKIIYPEKKPLIRQEGNAEKIFCLVRKRWVLLTPEEWVRQNFLLYLTEVLTFPASLIAVEKQLVLGELKKRFDIVVYDQAAKPAIIIECKEMNVPLSDQTIRQVLNYNMKIDAGLVVVTNGSYCTAFRIANGKLEEVNELQPFSSNKPA